MKKKIPVAVFLLTLICGMLALTTNEQGAYCSPSLLPAARASSSPFNPLLMVNATHPLPKDYQPEALVNLYDQSPRHFELASSEIELERQVFEAMNEMFAQAERENINGFIITSGYRSREKQQALYDESPEGFAALPGTSEHESGLAFDVTCYRDAGGFEESVQFEWLTANCWDFGFIIRYPEGAQSVTGIAYEPWHYRYVGVEAAQAMKQTGQTLEEYLIAPMR